MMDLLNDKRLIEIGDEVTLYYNNGTPAVTGIVLHIPHDTGDMWEIGLEGENLNWLSIYQNPNSSSFERIVLLTKHTELHAGEDIPF
jgi:hypothetical protein